MVEIGVLTGSVSRNAGGFYTSVRRFSISITAVSQSKVTVFSFRDDFTDVDMHKWAPLMPKIFTPLNLVGYALSPSLKKTILNTDVDLLHLHGIWTYTAYASLVWQRHTGRPLVISPRGMLDPWALKNSAWKKKIAGWFYGNRNLHSATCIHALCESEYQSIRDYNLKNPVCLIPNGIDLPNLQAGQNPPPWNPQIGTDKNVMLFIGRIHPKKGLENLIRAWGILKANKQDELKQWHLVIAGWSQVGHEEKLKQLADEMNLGTEVTFTGPLYDSDKDAAFRAAKAFILPSFSEGLPMSVLEAWSYGLPVIMTRQCNIPKGFDADAALDIRPDVESITERLRFFFGLSEDMRKDMGRNGLELVKSQYSWPKIAAEIVDVYKWVLGQSPKPESVRLE